MTPLDEGDRLRERMHKLADQVQVLAVQHVEQRGVQEAHGHRVDRLETTAVTRDQLESSVKLVSSTLAALQSETGVKLTALQTETNLKLDGLRSDLTPIKRGIYGMLSLLGAAVFWAVWALITGKVQSAPVG